MGQPEFQRTNFSGWLVANRDELLFALRARGFAPRFQRLVAEHVTYAYPDFKCAPAVTSAAVVGHHVGRGVEALVVAIDGSTHRPCGGTYHLTYSLDPGHEPVESNTLIVATNRTPISPINLRLVPF